MTLDEIDAVIIRDKSEDDERASLDESYLTSIQLLQEAVEALKNAERFIKSIGANNRATKKVMSELSNTIIELEMFVDSTE